MPTDHITFLNEGDKFLKTAQGGLKREKIFTPDILYNILSMSIEKYFMALSLFHNHMPFNHTFSDLMDSVAEDLKLPEDFILELKYFESLQEMCDLNFYHRAPLTREDILKMVNLSQRLQNLTKSICN